MKVRTGTILITIITSRAGPSMKATGIVKTKGTTTTGATGSCS